MADFEPGQTVGISCGVFPGAFSHEALVVLDTKHGKVSGFVNRKELVELGGDRELLRAKVVEVTEDTLTVWLRGSFFTTTGAAFLSSDWARSNVRTIPAHA